MAGSHGSVNLALMRRNVLALGLDPTFADFTQMPGLTPESIKAYIDSELERLRELGYAVESCLVDTGVTAESVAARVLASHDFDCVLIGAGLRAPAHLLLFEKLMNVVHAWAPGAKICFNTKPADTVDAVRRWLPA
ncbi:MAG: hypothetical protein ABI769_10580 [Pseudomonadota bacterium]